MVEIQPNLFVGAQHDYAGDVRGQDGWCVVQACREPYHRQALGYTGQSAPRHHPEYFAARRGDLLILNLNDAANPAHIPNQIMDAALDFIDESLGTGHRVLVHCNQGQSRAPAIGLLYLAAKSDVFFGLDYPTAHDHFRELYPLYAPSTGIRGFLTTHWRAYCRGHGHAEAANPGAGQTNIGPLR